MDSVSSDQAIITSHRHSSMHAYTIFMHHAYIVYHTIPILSIACRIFNESPELTDLVTALLLLLLLFSLQYRKFRVVDESEKVNKD